MQTQRLLAALTLALAGCTTDYPPTPPACAIGEYVAKVTVSQPGAPDGSVPVPPPSGTLCPAVEIAVAEDGRAKCSIHETLDPEWSPERCGELPGRTASDRSRGDRVTCLIEQVLALDGGPPTEPGWYMAPFERPDCVGPGRVEYTPDAEPRPGSLVELRCGVALPDAAACE